MFYEAIVISIVIMFIFMSIVFIVALLKADNSIVDLTWGMGLVLIAFVTFYSFGDSHPRQIIVSLMVTLWGIRLSLCAFSRRKLKHERLKYERWRKNWGSSFQVRNFLQVFMVQSIILSILTIPVVFINSSINPRIVFFDILGIIIWIIGYIIESTADRQLRDFKRKFKNPERVLNLGLWKYSRHPNFFGEFLMWWGIFLISIVFREFWILLPSPLLISILLLFVTGIPAVEKRYENNMQYQIYKKKTSAFIPWFPKSEDYIVMKEA